MGQTLAMRDGEPVMISCRGGPAGRRTATFPPPFDVEVDTGMYVLADEGPPEHLMCEFVDVGVSA